MPVMEQGIGDTNRLDVGAIGQRYAFRWSGASWGPPTYAGIRDVRTRAGRAGPELAKGERRLYVRR